LPLVIVSHARLPRNSEGQPAMWKKRLKVCAIWPQGAPLRPGQRESPRESVQAQMWLFPENETSNRTICGHGHNVYTQPRVWAPPKRLKNFKITKVTLLGYQGNSKRRTPMKSLLRAALLVLALCGVVAAFEGTDSAPSVPMPLPAPSIPCCHK
jgi:hypothetical protein